MLQVVDGFVYRQLDQSLCLLLQAAMLTEIGVSPVLVQQTANTKQGRPRKGRWADQGLSLQGRSGKGPVASDAWDEDPVTAEKGDSVQVAAADQAQHVRQGFRPKHKSASAAHLDTGGLGIVEQGRADPSSPAVVSADAVQIGAGQVKINQRHRQGRADASSPALASPAGGQLAKAQGRVGHLHRQTRADATLPALPSLTGGGQLGAGQGRAGQKASAHRRSSLGGGGVLPFAGHSFLLSAFPDEKQKERICHKITQLGGRVLDDVPKAQVQNKGMDSGCLVCSVQQCT